MCRTSGMMVGMEQLEIEIPNPHDWVDTAGAADLLGRRRGVVYDMVDRGVLARYRIGVHAVYWRPEVLRVAGALRTLERQK